MSHGEFRSDVSSAIRPIRANIHTVKWLSGVWCKVKDAKEAEKNFRTGTPCFLRASPTMWPSHDAVMTEAMPLRTT